MCFKFHNSPSDRKQGCSSRRSNSAISLGSLFTPIPQSVSPPCRRLVSGPKMDQNARIYSELQKIIPMTSPAPPQRKRATSPAHAPPVRLSQTPYWEIKPKYWGVDTPKLPPLPTIQARLNRLVSAKVSAPTASAKCTTELNTIASHDVAATTTAAAAARSHTVDATGETPWESRAIRTVGHFGNK